MGLFSWLFPKRKLTYIERYVYDENPRFIHLFGADRIMPDDGDSFDIYHHCVFDTERRMFHLGENQRGENLTLSSPFVQRSMDKISRELKTRLAFRKAAEDDEDDNKSRSHRPRILKRSGNSSDTETKKPPPDNCFIFIDYGSDALKFILEIYQHGRRTASLTFKGNCDYYFKRTWLENKEQLVFTYRKGGWAGGGMALAVVDYKTGKLLMDEYIPLST